MKRGSKKADKKRALPQLQLMPNDLLHFIEMDGFTDEWARLGLSDDDLTALQIAIMAGGKVAPIVRGSGGLRKLRFAPASWNVGKSGAVRVGFAYFQNPGIVLLIVAYGKNERDNLSKQELNTIHHFLREAEEEIHRRRQG